MTASEQRTDLPLCDLVMKGGATSGVVYPPVIAELAAKYRFANIGGTSAGAIAATVTAAAEYGRQRGHLSDFTPLNGLSDEISGPGTLLRLFRSTAPARLRPLLDTLLPLVSDPGAATGEPPPPSGLDLSPLARRIAPELTDLVLPPPPPGAPQPDQRLGQSIGAVLGGLAETHPEAHAAGARAGGQAGVRVGQILIYAAVGLALLFAAPLLLAGARPVAWAAWAILSALLVGAAYLGGQRISQAAVSAGGSLAALADLARLLLGEVPSNLYGICTGRRQPDSPADEPALTDWLSAWVARMAGPTDHGGPLTFGDLRQAGVNLQMVTTNLSHGRPYVLPFESDFVLLFRRGDADRLFPPDVVAYMCDARHTYPGWSLDALNLGLAPDDPERIYTLPIGDDLPVVVGMRMSLSFPVLISAIRLFTVSADVPRPEGNYRPLREHLQENWFSDGGICSNFPIHFFDSWLPTHPTFGINLTSLPRDAFDDGAAPASAIAPKAGDAPPAAPVQPGYVSQIAPEAPMLPLPHAQAAANEQFLAGALLGAKSAEPAPAASANARVLLPDAEQPLDPLWRPVESLTRFVWSMFDTAMNYRDTTQLMLPSYKERAVQIRLDGTREGGLNLNMPEDTVRKLQLYGHQAGALLRDRFDFDRHRWVRFRVLMGELERQILSLEGPLSAPGAEGRTLYEELMAVAQAQQFPFAESAGPPWVAGADTRVRALRALIGAWREANREDGDDEGAGERRVDDLTRVLMALTGAWRAEGLSAEESARRTAAVLALVEGWGAPEAPPRGYVGREVRFFKPVTTTGLELRVTPDL